MKLSDKQKQELQQINLLEKMLGFEGVDLLAFAEQYPDAPRYKTLGATIDANGNIHLEIEKEDEND